MTEKMLFNKYNKWLKYLAAVIIVGLLGKLALAVGVKREEYQLTRKATICPALLSISRSARDTLIVMRAEGLCDKYVLENLK